PATVRVVEPTGPETMLILDLAGSEVTALVRDRRAFAPGDAVTVAPDPAHLHLFDGATGARL
ncbi:MAG: TOBE domain-containing protein, partial [Pseudomonadota bacterium]